MLNNIECFQDVILIVLLIYPQTLSVTFGVTIHSCVAAHHGCGYRVGMDNSE